MAKKLLSLVSAISGLASFASAFVPEAKSNVAVYYGQGLAQPRLAEFCQDTTFDIINIGFINTFPDQDPLTGLPGSNFGNQCWADTYLVDGVPSKLYSQCPNLVEDIPACQAAGKKIFLSLGGGHKTYEIDTIDASTKFADWLWGAFGPKTDAWESAGSPRPFGDAVVDGFDFDIEYNGSWGYANMIKRLRRRFEEAPERRFYISAAPQCPIPDEQLGVAIANSVIDFIWVQFYNSNPCSARDFVAGTKNGFNFDEWVQVIKNGANPNAKLYVGLPASALAANLGYYLTPEEVQPLVKKYMNKYPKTFGGIMLWEATESKRNQIDGASYGEKMKDILYDLDPNHPTPTPSPTPTPTPTPTSTTTTTSTTSTSTSSTTTSTPTLTPTPSTTTPTPTPSGSPSGSSTWTSETSSTPSVTPSGSSTSVSSSSHASTSAPSGAASSSVVSSSTSVSVTSSSIPSIGPTTSKTSTSSTHTPTSTPSVSESSSVVSSSTSASSIPVVPGTSTSSHVPHSTSSTSIPSSTPGAHSSSSSSASSISSTTTECSESSTATSSHSLSSTPSVSKTPSASSPVVSPSSSTSTETTVTMTVFPTPSSSRVPTPSSSVPSPSTDCTETEIDSTSAATSRTSSTSTSRPVIPTTSTSSRSTISTSGTVTPTPSVSGVPTSSPSETTSSSQTTDGDCDETATATAPAESTTQPTTGLTTKPTDTGSVTTQPTTTEPAITTTLIVTSYTSICPTGFTTITTTITSTYCPGTASATATGTDIPGSVQPTGPPDIPEGWTTTVTVCNVCAATPTTVTLTLPPATTTGESTPVQPTDVPAEVPSDGGYTTIPGLESTTGESRPAQPTGNSPVGAPHHGEGYTTIIGPGSTTTVVVVPAHPASTSNPVIGGVSSAYPSSTFYVQPSASRVPVAPSGTQGGEAPVFTGAASRISGLAKGASMVIAAALSMLVVM